MRCIHIFILFDVIIVIFFRVLKIKYVHEQYVLFCIKSGIYHDAD